MAKLKPARSKTKGKSTVKQSTRAAVPCIVLILGIMALLMLLFFYALKG
ncbi:MAG: hypothetical protein ACM336_00805 [Acidobacteriota bacterium]